MMSPKSWLVVCVAALLTACAGPTMIGDWLNPGFQGPAFKKILVMGISPDSNVRRIFEDQFVAELQARNVDAMASYRQTQDDGQLGEDQIREIMRKTGAGAVVVTRVARVDRETVVNPGSTRVTTLGPARNHWGDHRHDNFYGLYRSAWTTHMPPTVHEFDVYTLETNLWSVDGNELVWSGTTESLAPSNVFREIEQLIGLVIDAWVKRGLI
jgi:hypothetical protein